MKKKKADIFNVEMKRTRLIQRLCKPENFEKMGFKDNPFSFGGGMKNGGLSDKAMDILREIFSVDYMGAAEFEYGAFPKALQKMISGNLVAGSCCGGEVFYISPKAIETEAVTRIEMLRKGVEYQRYDKEKETKILLKERCMLKEWFEPDSFGWKNTRCCGWAELDNGFMFFVDKEMFVKMCEVMDIRQEVADEKQG